MASDFCRRRHDLAAVRSKGGQFNSVTATAEHKIQVVGHADEFGVQHHPRPAGGNVPATGRANAASDRAKSPADNP